MAYESRLSLTVDSTTGERRLRSFRSELSRTETAGDSAASSIDRTSSSVDDLGRVSRLAAGAVAGLAGAMGAREIIGYSDAWTNARNRIIAYADSVEQAEFVQSQLVGVAKDTRSSLSATAELYSALARSNDDLGLSQERLISLTETINKTFALSGAGAAAADGAIRQLSQGLASGALRGDEFNSVAEQAPDIMRAIADSLDMTIGELREFAATGGITAEIVVNALTEAADEIDNRFSKSIATFEQHIENARTNLTEFVGTSDALNDAVSGLGQAIETASEHIDTIANVAVMAGGVFAARLAGGAASAGAAMLAAQIEAARYQATLATMAGISGRAAAAQLALAGATRAAGSAMALLGGPAGVIMLAAGAAYYFRDSLFETKQETSELADEMGRLSQNLNLFTRAELESKRASLTTELSELKAEATELADELERAEEAERMSNIMYQGRPGAASHNASELRRQYQALAGDIALIEDGISEVDGAIERLNATQQSASSSISSGAESATSAMDDLLSRIQAIRNEVDPLGAEFERVGQQIMDIQYAMALGKISSEDGAKLIQALVERMSEGGEAAGDESGEVFAESFSIHANRVADSLQDAIASGDWDGIGATVGASLASGIAQTVSAQVSGSLGAGIASAIGGPIAGAIAGGVVGLAAEKIADYFHDDWDPTEMRQAAQGTGTILGSIDEKSRSISKAMDITSGATTELVGINRAMLSALESVQLGISGASAIVARGYSGSVGSISAPGVMSGGDVLSGAILPFWGGAGESIADAYLDYLSTALTGGLVDLGSVLGGKSKKRDEGIRIIGGYISDLVDNTVVQAYATYKVKKHAFDDYDTKEKYVTLGSDVQRQFALVFDSVYDSVAAGVEALGMDFEGLASGFKVGTQRLSLEGMDASEQQAELEAYFGTVFDKLAGYTVPWLEDFQEAGEGLGETLARVATQTQVAQQAIDSLGIQFDDLTGRSLVDAANRLVEAGGGLDSFISDMQSFIGNFATEEQQFALSQQNLTKALEQANMTLPETRAGYYDLMQAQNGSTETGAENIATLLSLQSTADQYYSMLEDQADELASLQQESLQAAQYAADAVADALEDIRLTGGQYDVMQRESALNVLREMVASGRVEYGDTLADALSAATDINASDYASFDDYIRDIARTGSVLTDLQAITDEQVSVEQMTLNAIERQEAISEQQLQALVSINSTLGGSALSVPSIQTSAPAQANAQLAAEVKAMREELAAQQAAIAKHTAKTAKIIERIELNGLEVRE